MLLFLFIESVVTACTIFEVDCLDNAKIKFKVDTACASNFIPHVSFNNLSFSGWTVTGDGGWPDEYTWDAAKYFSSSGTDPVVYSGKVSLPSTADYNTNDIIVHNTFEPQEFSCSYNLSDAVVNVEQAIQTMPTVTILRQDDMNEINNIDSTVEFDITADGESLQGNPAALGSLIKIEFSFLSGVTSFFIEKCKSMNMASIDDPDYKELILIENGCLAVGTVDVWDVINPNVTDSGRALLFNQFAFTKPSSTDSTVNELVFQLECSLTIGEPIETCASRRSATKRGETVSMAIELDTIGNIAFKNNNGIITKHDSVTDNSITNIVSLFLLLAVLIQ